MDSLPPTRHQMLFFDTDIDAVVGALRDARPHRTWRDGGGAARGATRANGVVKLVGPQVPVARAGRGRRVRRDVPRRGAPRRAAQPPERRADVRGRAARGTPRFIAMEYLDGQPLNRVLAPPGRRDRARARRRACASSRACSRGSSTRTTLTDFDGTPLERRPPRREPAQRLRHVRRARQARRLRHRQDARGEPPDAAGRHQGQARVHRARGHSRRARRPPRRRLLGGRHAVGDPGGPAPVGTRERGRERRVAPRRGRARARAAGQRRNAPRAARSSRRARSRSIRRRGTRRRPSSARRSRASASTRPTRTRAASAPRVRIVRRRARAAPRARRVPPAPRVGEHSRRRPLDYESFEVSSAGAPSPAEERTQTAEPRPTSVNAPTRGAARCDGRRSCGRVGLAHRPRRRASTSEGTDSPRAQARTLPTTTTAEPPPRNRKLPPPASSPRRSSRSPSRETSRPHPPPNIGNATPTAAPDRSRLGRRARPRRQPTGVVGAATGSTRNRHD